MPKGAARRGKPDSAYTFVDHFQRAQDPDLRDLYDSFRFDPDNAEIMLNGQRMVLTDNASLAILRRELISALGYEQARATMSRIGYTMGANDARLALALRKDASLFEGYAAGPQLHALMGSVKVVPVVFDADRNSGHFYCEYEWHNSAECLAHCDEIGIGPYPGGWQQIGYAAGYSSAFFGRPIVYREIQCVAMGHPHCYLIGKPVEDWDEPEKELRWFRAETYTAPQSDGPQPQPERLQNRTVVGASPGFNVALHLIEKVAKTDVPVLFLGESGVGKEVFARELRRRSRRSDKEFVALNCAAIPETLVEAELFGVEKGAFTGADGARAGRFERASGGTLFLDEVGTLSPAAQGKLLRVLQEGEFERVGGTRTIRCDVRIIAATNADLRSDVEKGTFRADLLYRLNTFPIWIPPLRDRRADIPILANHFLRKFSQRHGRNNLSFDESLIRLFNDYAWPGNIRELENTIERGVILANDDEAISVHHLMMAGHALNQQSDRSHDALADFIVARARNSKPASIRETLLSLRLSHDELVDELVAGALDRCEGNQSEAARMIGMSRSQIAYRVKSRLDETAT